MILENGHSVKTYDFEESTLNYEDYEELNNEEDEILYAEDEA